jgi:hypothetical protein
MFFADDSDLLRVQPSVFEHGVASFEDFHDLAGDEIVRDLKMYWLRYHHIISLNLPTWWDKSFNPEKLNPLQWNTAAVYRVLGWHVLPMLHSSVTLEGTTLVVDGMKISEMQKHYRSEYEREFNFVLRSGLEYDLDNGSGYTVVNRSSVAELQRLLR